MKKITTQNYKLAFQENHGEEVGSVEDTISQINLPPEVKNALITALHENKDSYFQTYIRALPEAVVMGNKIGRLDDAIKSQLHYIYSNMEEYKNEEVKTIIADFLNIPLEDRHQIEENNNEDYDEDYEF